MVLELYEKVKNDETKRFPPNFWNKDSFKEIFRYLVFEVYNYDSEDKIYKHINQKFLINNSLSRKVFSTVYDAVEYCLPEYNLIPWKFNLVAHGFWDKEFNKIYALKWFIEQLIKDGIIVSIEEASTKIRQKHFNDYGLSGLLDNIYNKNMSVFDLFNLAYQDKWALSDFTSFKKGYTDSSIDELKLIVRDTVKDKLNCNKREDLLNIGVKDFKKVGLQGLLTKYFKNSPTQCIIDCFPEYELLEWEFTKTQGNFWSLEENRIAALRDLIEIKLKLNINEIPDVISYAYLKANFYKFIIVADKYYHSDIFTWVNLVYPNKFKIEDFYNHICNDGTKVLSNEELIIHNHLLEEIRDVNKVKYIGTNKEFKIYNEKHEEHYIPDWIINGNVVIEYFGLYYENRKDKRNVDYVNKTHRKVEFFSKFCEENPQYNFIVIYPSDLKRGMMGLKNKISNIQKAS